MKEITAYAPGRINIIGEHTDYNDGYVLPAAIDKKTTLKLRKNNHPTTCTMIANNMQESYTFDLSNFKPLQSGWQNYVMGVVHELQKRAPGIEGFECSFEGDVPIGGGMSSSASLECGLAKGINALFDLGLDDQQLVQACQMSEHNFVGIKCGIMDQFTSMMGKKNHVLLLDCRSLEYQYFPLDLQDYSILLLNTNVAHALASSAYNTRINECQQGVELLKKQDHKIQSLRDVSLSILETCKDKIPEKVYQRCDHVVRENMRVLQATEALTQGDFGLLGHLMYQSHKSLQHQYEVSCTELDFLVRDTLDKDYILGSRMMGGGFGGCTISIIQKDKVDPYVEAVQRRYKKQYGIDCTPYFVGIADGASAE